MLQSTAWHNWTPVSTFTIPSPSHLPTGLMLLAQMATRHVNHQGEGLMMLADAAEQVEAAQADLVRIDSAFGHAAAPLRAPATLLRVPRSRTSPSS